MKNNTSTENISVNKLKSLCHKVFYLSSVGKLVHRRILEFIFFFLLHLFLYLAPVEAPGILQLKAATKI